VIRICRADLDDEWYCTLADGHPGNHEAHGVGGQPALRTWPQSPPRTWSLPPEPGPEVTRVLDRYGQYFERDDDLDEVQWIGQTFTGDGDVDDLVLPWGLLMAYQSPLTDATPATEETKPS
jgi:hypothetical protein